ncbi:MAG: hypothetical protein GX282_01410 [Campylobacteraceae bacterium]|nr:hypothetical protein [Campylobacteraceae bacterium]
MSLKIKFISFFRGIFLRSGGLEFRAKVFASMLLAKESICESDFEILEEILKEIYPKSRIKQELIIAIVKEYIYMVEKYKDYDLDRVLKEIDRSLKLSPRFTKKINFAHLRRLISKNNENDALIQQRVYEFLLNEVKIYEN